jgi:hypothetical protein
VLIVLLSVAKSKLNGSSDPRRQKTFHIFGEKVVCEKPGTRPKAEG